MDGKHPQSGPPPRLGLPDFGVGVGLRIPHYATIFEQSPPDRPDVDWFEIISENFMVGGGLPLKNLDRALERYPLIQHGVSLSIGSTEPLDRDYLTRLKALLRKTKSPWLSDHLCWTGAHGVNLHDLLPLPYTEQAAEHGLARGETQPAIWARPVEPAFGKEVGEFCSCKRSHERTDVDDEHFRLSTMPPMPRHRADEDASAHRQRIGEAAGDQRVLGSVHSAAWVSGKPE